MKISMMLAVVVALALLAGVASFYGCLPGDKSNLLGDQSIRAIKQKVNERGFGPSTDDSNNISTATYQAVLELEARRAR